METTTTKKTKATTTKKSTTTAKTPTTKPRAAAKPKTVELPFKGGDVRTVKTPNGQMVSPMELRMLSGKLNLETKFGRPADGQSAESMVQTLLKTQKKGANLVSELSAFNLQNVLIKQGKQS